MTAAIIIDSALNGFKASWAARSYLLRLAVVPFALKLLCLTIALKLAGSGGGLASMQSTLIMLPAFFAEGWMLSHYVRYLILGQTWPFRPSGDMQADMDALRPRARGILSGMIVYVLIALAQGAVVAVAGAYLLPFVPQNPGQGATMPASAAMLAIALLVFIVWSFRFVWLYIPLALNADFRETLARLRPGRVNLFLIGLWLVCFVPFVAAIQILEPFLQLLGPTFGGFALVLASVGVDLVKMLVITASMTFGFKYLFEQKGGEGNS